MTTQSTSTERRKFLQTAAALIAASSVVTRKSINANDVPKVHSGSGNIRVGLVGCGGRGNGAAINAMDAGPDIKIVALGDLFDESIQSCRKLVAQQRPDQFLVDDDHVFVGFDAFKKVIDSDIDVVLLASPPYYRPDHIEYAVAAGKHIFAEKPIATDSYGVRRVEAACMQADAKGLNVVSGLCWRYDEGVRQTIAKVQDGAIGTLVATQANYLSTPVWLKPRLPDETEMQYQCRNWYNYTWLSGDHYVEQFIHSLDKAMWLRNDVPPVKAYGMGGRQLRSDETQGNIYDHFAVVYEWADQTVTYAYTRQMAGCKNETEDYIMGTQGKARLIAHKVEGNDPWSFEGEKTGMYEQEHIELFDAVRGKRERINNGTYMCRSTMMAILGREVCYSGKELTYEQVATSPQKLGPETLDWAQIVDVVVPQPGRYKFPLASNA